jgi:hypothetical protein
MCRFLRSGGTSNISAEHTRLLEGKAAHMEALLWHYAYGAPPSKPVDAMTLMCEDILETDGADV